MSDMSAIEALFAKPIRRPVADLRDLQTPLDAIQSTIKCWRLSGTRSTSEQYAAAILRYEAHCQAVGVAAQPGTPETVAGFLWHRRTVENVSKASLDADARAIRQGHLACGLPDPTDDPIVKDALGRKRGTSKVGAMPSANNVVHLSFSPTLTSSTAVQQRRVVPGSELPLAEIDPIVDFYKVHSLASATRFSYSQAWMAFLTFCGRHGFCPLPARVETVCRFLAEYGLTRKPSTLSIAKAAIRWVHRNAGMCSPTDHPDVEAVMRGHARARGTHPAQKYALTRKDVVQMCHAMDEEGGIIAIRDRAILLLGFAGAFRRSEITRRDVYYDDEPHYLEMTDLAFNRHGVMIRLRKSKTDQEAQGQEVFITYGAQQKTCAVVALQCWIELLRQRGFTSGPLFRSVFKSGDRLRGDAIIQDKPLDPKSMVLRLKYWANKIGLDPATIGGHSLRAGHVTAAAERGASLLSIAAQGRWEDMTTVRKYYRRATAHRDNSSSALGL